jgi:tRNA-splicing ligase RtcB (3'-phosphate/5'-hydroxy nucleic acid ligase)
MSEPLFEVIDAGNGRIIKAWKKGVPFEEKAIEQLKNSARLPCVFRYVAAMPDTHWGMGATVGSVLPTKGAIVPAAVGVDIGCGMMAVCTRLAGAEVRPKAADLRAKIEAVVPHGRTDNGGPRDIGGWSNTPDEIRKVWDAEFSEKYDELAARHSGAITKNTHRHLGTLGTGNHFIEVCVDESDRVWIMLHSGSRGMGNKIGGYFTKLAQQLCERWFIELPDRNLAYLPMGTTEFNDYLKALNLAQKFAWRNREIMMARILEALGVTGAEEVHCHHNYSALEQHFGENIWVTRKGAVRAREGDLGIIPGSMGARSYIVRGLGSEHSFCSCSHGAGRAMGRQEAKRRFTVEDHLRATEGVECHKGAEVIDETPAAYKDIDAVMAAQRDLVEIVHVLKQLVCVKGLGDSDRR